MLVGARQERTAFAWRTRAKVMPPMEPEISDAVGPYFRMPMFGLGVQRIDVDVGGGVVQVVFFKEAW